MDTVTQLEGGVTEIPTQGSWPKDGIFVSCTAADRLHFTFAARAAGLVLLLHVGVRQTGDQIPAPLLLVTT